jgi:diguanylate cyclase (GGDEF)-like protein
MEKRKRPDDVPKLIPEDEGELEETKTNVSSSRAPLSGRGSRPFLLVLAGGSVGELLAITQPEMILGRERNVSIHIDDEGVSRRHAKLICSEAGVHIEDLGSANGTFVNDTRVGAARLLTDGDKITLATTVLKFTYSDDVEESFQRRMFEAVLRDGLTKAYNKKYLWERLDKELAFSLRHGSPLSILLLDLDHFKNVNDTFGHPAGDAVLVAFADTVHGTIRTEDVFARYGGEEFAVLCRATDVRSAGILAERIRVRVESACVRYEDNEIRVTISAGVAGFPELQAKTPEELISAADDALYEAKRGGRNRVIIREKVAG